MKVFLDTEFTSLDSRFQELISVGMVDETGQRELYLEVSGFRSAYATEFVHRVVMPLLGCAGVVTVGPTEVETHVRNWLRSLGEPVTPVVDSPTDIRVVPGLRAAPEVAGAALLVDEKGAVCGLWIDNYFEAHRDRPRHHALEDARALRMAYHATRGDLDGEHPLDLRAL